jgi:Mg/Co/Ni transporter MgtE
MKRLNFDPAHSSVVILTTITDIFGLFSLFMLAKLIL